MSYKNTQRWRYKAKRWLTQYMGGCCQCCGYKEYEGNLTAHHLGIKQEGLSRMINRCAAWDEIISEANKCVLVCMNCHGEIHAGKRVSPKIDQTARAIALEALVEQQPKPKQFSCKVCGKESKNKDYCSNACKAKGQEKIEWPANIFDLSQKTSKLELARRLGVSGKAVEKRLKKLEKMAQTSYKKEIALVPT